MKTKNILFRMIWCFLLAILVFSCQKDQGPDAIYVYFLETSVNIRKSQTDVEVLVPVNVFAEKELVNKLVVNYELEGNNGQLEDVSGGHLTFLPGFAGYRDYIVLKAAENSGEGDATITITLLSSINKSFIAGIGDGIGNRNSTLSVNVIDDVIHCLAAVWTSDNVTMDDLRWPGYVPTNVVGELVSDEDCYRLEIHFNFWGDSRLRTTLLLQLSEETDPETNKGTVTLLEDFNAVGGGYDVTFHAGPAGEYDLNTLTINLALEFSGYSIGGDGKYRFRVNAF